jgi:hypothetical protein
MRFDCTSVEPREGELHWHPAVCSMLTHWNLTYIMIDVDRERNTTRYTDSRKFLFCEFGKALGPGINRLHIEVF